MAQGDQRRMRIMLGILVVLVVVFVGRVALGGGDDGGGGDTSGATTTTVALPEPGGAEATDPETQPPAATDGGGEPGESLDGFGSRNPFEPPGPGAPSPPPPTAAPPAGDDLAVGDVAAGDVADGDVADGGPTGESPAADDGTGDGTQPLPASDATETVDPTHHVITLVDVYDAAGTFRARVQVDTTVHDVGVGDTLAGRYRVVELDATCGQLLRGEETVLLCEGEQLVE